MGETFLAEWSAYTLLRLCVLGDDRSLYTLGKLVGHSRVLGIRAAPQARPVLRIYQRRFGNNANAEVEMIRNTGFYSILTYYTYVISAGLEEVQRQQIRVKYSIGSTDNC